MRRGKKECYKEETETEKEKDERRDRRDGALGMWIHSRRFYMLTNFWHITELFLSFFSSSSPSSSIPLVQFPLVLNFLWLEAYSRQPNSRTKNDLEVHHQIVLFVTNEFVAKESNKLKFVFFTS